MKIKNSHSYPAFKILLVITGFVLYPVVSHGSDQLSLMQAPGSWVQLEGDSTMHQYHSTATVIQASAVLEGDLEQNTWERLLAGGLTSLTVDINVLEMKSGKNGLDKNLQKALNADKFPNITFNISSYQIHPSTHSSTAYDMNAEGTLSVAGTEKPIVLMVMATASNDTLTFEGEKDLLMTDFNIQPPKMMLGAIKTSNEIVIRFNLVLKKS